MARYNQYDRAFLKLSIKPNQWLHGPHKSPLRGDRRFLGNCSVCYNEEDTRRKHFKLIINARTSEQLDDTVRRYLHLQPKDIYMSK